MQRSELTLPENSEVDLTCAIDEQIIKALEDGWRENYQKQRNVMSAINYGICEFAKEVDDDLRDQETENVYNIAEHQEEYDK